MILIPLPDSNVTRYIPQRAPIVMVHELLESNGSITVTSFTIMQEALFVKDGALQEPGLIENMAQAAAAGVGYQFALKEEPIPPGFIGAIKNLSITSLPQTGQQLITRVEILEEIFGITLIKAEISVQAKIIASCEMKIVLKQE